uniref:Exportin-2 n=1 Tax=Aegilops tauschii TaxID=37682 RepID=M8BZI4_AEGTA
MAEDLPRLTPQSALKMDQWKMAATRHVSASDRSLRLVIAAASDFPARWDSLLPSIVSSLGAALSAGDVPAANALLAAALPLFSRFRTDLDTDPLRIELNYCLQVFAAPLLEVFLSTSHSLLQPRSSAAQVFECLRLCCEVFYSFLTTSYPQSVEADGAPDALRAAVCNNLQLYIEKYEEELMPYLEEFAEAVWGLLLAAVSPRASRDQLAVTAIRAELLSLDDAKLIGVTNVEAYKFNLRFRV